MRRALGTLIAALLVSGSVPAGGSAQSLSSRVAGVSDGAVTFHFAAREGVCGDGRSFVRMGRSYMGDYSHATREPVCDLGPIQVRLTLNSGAVQRVESWVGPLRDRGARDSATRARATRQDAAFWLSRFAAGAIVGHPNELVDDDAADDDDGVKGQAVFVLSQLPNRSGVSTLLEVARTNPDRRVRGKALFWLGQSGDSRALALFERLLGG